MRRYKKIAAISFLSIFSMLLLHQILPHVHHKHEGFEGAITKIGTEHHSHDVDHHHHDEEEKEDFDFLGFLLVNHAHGVDAKTIPTVKNVVVQKIVNKSAPVEIPIILDARLALFGNEKKPTFDHAPPDFGKSVYLSTCSLRGPPFIG